MNNDSYGVLKVEVDALLDRLAYMEQRISENAQRWQIEGYRRAIENLHGEALRRVIAALRNHPAGESLLQEMAADDVVYTVLRQHDIIEPPIEDRVHRALKKARPQLESHGGGFEVLAIEPPRLVLRFLGACDGCSAQEFTLRSVLASALKLDCPEITEIAEAKDSKEAEEPMPLKNEGWRPAGLLDEIPDGGARDTVVDREGLLLIRRGDTVNCFSAYCPHRGVGIDSRDIEADGILTCYRHGYRFDLATGECLSAPGLSLERHDVSIADGKLMVRLPIR
jgi:nitrite reductase/ring-hydroxylating ferredoxin subunit/Fe-S cluster biogenesis protein NfuA